jgi:hypothetical protein
MVIASIPACGGSPIAPTPEAISSSPSVAPTLRPTITTLPTYTPRPVKTATPAILLHLLNHPPRLIPQQRISRHL